MNSWMMCIEPCRLVCCCIHSAVTASHHNTQIATFFLSLSWRLFTGWRHLSLYDIHSIFRNRCKCEQTLLHIAVCNFSYIYICLFDWLSVYLSVKLLSVIIRDWGLIWVKFKDLGPLLYLVNFQGWIYSSSTLNLNHHKKIAIQTIKIFTAQPSR